MALYDVFISYSSKDQKVVEGICGYLEARGIRCFVSFRDIPKGVVWASAIVEALDESVMMLVAFSENFNLSPQVDREIELAAEDNKPILTFRLCDSKFKGAKKYYLKNLNWIDAFPNPDNYFHDLYVNICKLLGKTPIAFTSPQSSQNANSGIYTNNANNNDEEEIEVVTQALDELQLLQAKAVEDTIGEESIGDLEELSENIGEDAVEDTIGEESIGDLEELSENIGEDAVVQEEVEEIAVELYDKDDEIELINCESEQSPSLEDSQSGIEPTLPLPNPITPTEQVVNEPIIMGNDHEWVDLGLPSGVKWATCNIGAIKPEEYGEYFVWGDPQPKMSFSDKKILTANKDFDNLVSLGIIDTDGNLTKVHDAATQQWGEPWRMPTKEEIDELVENTDDLWTSVNGVKGKLLTSKINGKTIFIPASGFGDGKHFTCVGTMGYAWSSTVKKKSDKKAYSANVMKGFFMVDTTSRCEGHPVRPVFK